MRRGIGISPWGASAWECPPCPAVETKRSGRRELRAEGIQRQFGAPVSAARAAPPDLYEQGRAGTARGGGEGEETRTRWGGGEVERKGARPRPVTPGAETRPRRPGRGDNAAPARRPTSSIPRRRAAGACCRGRMKSSPREAWILLIINMKRSGQGDSRSGRGAANPRPFLHSAGLFRTFGLPRWGGRLSPVPGPAWPLNFVCSSPCLTLR